MNDVRKRAMLARRRDYLERLVTSGQAKGWVRAELTSLRWALRIIDETHPELLQQPVQPPFNAPRQVEAER